MRIQFIVCHLQFTKNVSLCTCYNISPKFQNQTIKQICFKNTMLVLLKKLMNVYNIITIKENSLVIYFLPIYVFFYLHYWSITYFFNVSPVWYLGNFLNFSFANFIHRSPQMRKKQAMMKLYLFVKYDINQIIITSLKNLI